MSFSDLPTLNAILNASSAILLLIGHRYMEKGNITAHKRIMLSVFAVSGLFLISYLFYHYHHGSQPFRGEGLVRVIYFGVLIPHTILAAMIIPLGIVTLLRGLKGNYESHKKIARWTYPIWLYVSATGVIIYVMLYHLFTGSW